MSAMRLVITGGLGALGSALVRKACEQGHAVAVIEHGSKGDLPAGAHLIGGVDLTDAHQASAAMQQAHQALGGIDGLVNVAGGFRWVTVSDTKSDDWSDMFAMNVMTASNATRAALPALKASGRGSVVMIGAAGALKASAGMGPYAASKSGVHRLVEALADELKSEGVRVNAVLPSIIDTPANRKDMPDADPAAWVSPDALAEVIVFLLSEGARDVTGALVPVTGRV